jgi:hypothetical protein
MRPAVQGMFRRRGRADDERCARLWRDCDDSALARTARCDVRLKQNCGNSVRRPTSSSDLRTEKPRRHKEHEAARSQFFKVLRRVASCSLCFAFSQYTIQRAHFRVIDTNAETTVYVLRGVRRDTDTRINGRIGRTGSESTAGSLWIAASTCGRRFAHPRRAQLEVEVRGTG